MDWDLGKFWKQDWMSWTITIMMILLCVTGVLFIRSAQAGEEGALSRVWVSQAVYMCIGLVVYFIVMMIDYRLYIRFSWLIYIVSMVLLVAVLVVGEEVNTTKGWLRIAGVGIQPAEPAKLAMTLLMATFLGSIKIDPTRVFNIIVALVIFLIPLGLVFLQPDFGSAIVMVPVAFAIMYVAGAKKTHLLIIAIIGFTLSLLLWHDFIPGVKLKQYQKDRILSFTDHNRDWQGTGYQLRQTKIAMGSGGVFGKGYMKGTQSRMGYLPKAIRHSDAIVSVVGEEVGFLGCTALLIVYAILLLVGINIGIRSVEKTGKLVCAGIVVILFVHVYENVGMALGIMPITGIPLPLISNGGSFAIIVMGALGIIQSVNIHPKPQKNFI
ncbi:MAG: rod shape-determining protein RodA [Verrucomicrobiota bacterium]|nr:rod shape-determining protein RodA [Verrucomicrobiota bacterium]